MKCTVDYSVMGPVADHCARQDFFGYVALAGALPSNSPYMMRMVLFA